MLFSTDVAASVYNNNIIWEGGREGEIERGREEREIERGREERERERERERGRERERKRERVTMGILHAVSSVS